MSLPFVSQREISSSYDVVVVGAGVQGLAVAYELAKRGVTKVAVLDRSWPGSGASDRNGELIRSAFSTPEWTQLFHRSLQRWHGLSAELDFNVLFSPAGYVIVASTDDQWEACRRNQPVHHSNGIRTELVDEREVRHLLPAADPAMIRGGLVQPGAGFAHHDAVVWAYLRAAAQMGVEVHVGVDVVGIRAESGRVCGVGLGDGSAISSPVVINAAGAGAPEVNELAGIDVPLVQARLEMLVTESLAPFIRPGVAVPELLGYCHQTARGEFVGGTELAFADQTSSVNSSYALLRDMASKWVRFFPVLAGARLLRHWAGTVSQSADLAPVLGEAKQLSGFFVSCGWVYGFMGAPAAGELLAENIVTGTTPALLAPFYPERLREGRLINETSLVVTSDGA